MVKKICFVAPFYSFAAERFLSSYERIFPKDVELTLVCPKRDINKFKFKRFKRYGYKNKFESLFFLRKLCRLKEFDVITNVSRREKIALLLILATLFLKTKILFYDHGNPKKKNLFFLFFLQFFFDRILVCARDIEKKVKKWLFFSKKKIFYLPTPVDSSFFRPTSKKTARKSVGVKLNDKVIVFVGRIQYMKGSDFLLKVIKNNPDKKFILVGRIEDKNYIPLPKNAIIFNNPSDNFLREIYNSADLALFLSRTEGMSLSLREGMSCGVYTIVSNIESNRTIKSVKKVNFNIFQIQKAIDDYFKEPKNLKRKQSNKVRLEILREHSEKALFKRHLKYFLEWK